MLNEEFSQLSSCLSQFGLWWGGVGSLLGHVQAPFSSGLQGVRSNSSSDGFISVTSISPTSPTALWFAMSWLPTVGKEGEIIPSCSQACLESNTLSRASAT